MASPRSDSLFKQYPITTELRTSAGPVPIPYHVYDGRVLMIGGTAELGTVNELVKDEHLSPLRDSAGRALMVLWVCDFSDASLGPHKELQISFIVKRGPSRPINAHPLAVHRALLIEPGVGMFCHAIWNDTNAAVTYNREILSLPVHLATSSVGHDAAGITSFAFKLASNSRPLVAGKILDTLSQPANVGRLMFSALGLGGMLRLMRRPDLHVQVINPITKTIEDNLAADTYTRSQRQIVRLYDPAIDQIAIQDDAYRQLGFWPQFVQQMEGFRFVYLNPEAWPGGPAIQRGPAQTRPTFQNPFD